ncbi:LLM class flavin-dependent oxidoreductase [Kutzneria sp. 744]|uniref:LLM class flavin-dependent oxidoreductase n=1 Tax=Kutzneria sp. (strain 744) TaxID=345341 RepID=UPI0003EEC402|nr:LLM class flavin-dependent oxidoreductase [Kutzneria sp. 744]EWM11909.1 LigA protein [Kutzneria sp. 744]
MKIGIGMPNQVRDVDPTVIPEWAKRAEAAGFSALGTIGRIAYPGVMDTVALAAAAGATSTIGLLSQVMLTTVWPGRLLAKELAGIDGVSGGRLTLGIGLGGREDDFVVEGLGMKGLGKRLDADLESYREVWTGQPVGGGANPGVPTGTREVPMLIGGTAAASFKRMAKWGAGYIVPGLPAADAAVFFDQARAAWREAGRVEEQRLVAGGYFALGDPDRGRANVLDYYAGMGEYADMAAAHLSHDAESVRATVAAFRALGVTEYMLVPATDDVTDIDRLAEIVF